MKKELLEKVQNRAGGGLEKNKLKQRSIAIEAFWNDSKQVC